MISPYAKRNYVDHTVLDITSILRFVEDNWRLGRIDSLDNPDGTAQGNPPPGQGSFDRLAGSITGLFDFDDPVGGSDYRPLLLNDTPGELMQH